MVMQAKPVVKSTSEAAIFGRVWDTGNGALSPELARYILALRFPETDLARMHELAASNREGRLAAAERDELDSYIKVGDLLAILQSKARQRLKKRGRAGNGRG
jgi:hypothetical protein